MPIHLEFTPTFEDYFDSLRLHVKRSLWLRMNWFGVRVIAPVWGVLSILGAFWMLTWGPPGVSVGIVMVCGICLAGYPFYWRFKLKRCYVRTRTGDGSRAYDFGETQIRAQEPGAKSEIEWSAVRSIAEDKKVFLLYLAPAKYILIPKRLCAEEVADELQKLFAEKIRSSEPAQVAG
jgi:hypothetical protein